MEKEAYLYWDAPAILAALIKEARSSAVLKWAGKEGLHLISSLAYAEVVAVIDRMERERLLTRVLAESAYQAMLEGPWRFIHFCPSRKQVDLFRGQYPLRGADLWHLALAKALESEIPGLKILTFDKKLAKAAESESIATPL